MPIGQLVYTDLPRGKGLNPSNSGYQIKACSEGITTEQQEWLAAICMHYGETVYRFAPPSAINAETDWRAHTDNVRLMPATVLDAFPQIVSYTRVGEDRFALTRVRYTGITHDGRTGNFTAHSLLFAPSELANCGSSPLAVARGGFFDRLTPGDETRLPELPALTAAAPLAGMGMLSAPPYCDQLPALLSALIAAKETSRPVILRLADWRDAAPLIEALFDLLPPAVRRATSFCSYESDRNWLPGARGQRPAGWVAGHQLIVLCGTDERQFGLRSDEYSGRFAIFNFVANQFSENGAPRAYAVWAAQAGQTSRLGSFHSLLARLDAETDPAAWDALVPLAVLGDNATPEELSKAAHALISVAVQHDQPAPALQWLESKVSALASAGDANALAALRPDLAFLLDRLPAGAPESQRFVEMVASQARTAFKNGALLSASGLLALTGKERTRLTLDLLRQVLVTHALPPPDLRGIPEKDGWLALLQDGLLGGDQFPELALPKELLVKAIFQTAAAAGRSEAVWNAYGKSLVMPWLDGAWSPEKQALAQDLLRWLPASQDPDAAAWLGLKLAQNARLSPAELLAALKGIAAAAGGCADPAKIVADLVAVVEKSFPEGEARAAALGVLAENAGDARGGEKLAEYFLQSAERLDGKARLGMRRKLAEAGALGTLTEELARDVLPWEPVTSAQRMQQWRDAILTPFPAAGEFMRGAVAETLLKNNDRAGLMALSIELLPRGDARPDAGSLALARVLARLVPLTPGDLKRGALTRLADSLPREDAARLRIMNFLDQVQATSRQPGWSLDKFPFTQNAWSQDVAVLPGEEKKQVLQWVLDTVSETGITQAGEASALKKLLDAIREQEWLGDAALILLRGRDPVTCVNAAAAFAQLGLNSSQPYDWGILLGMFTRHFGRDTLRLLEDHLAQRFAPRDDKYQDRLRQLCEGAGLKQPASSVDQPRSQQVSAEQPAVPGGQGGTQGDGGKPASGGDAVSRGVSRGISRVTSLFGKRSVDSSGKPEDKKPG